MNSPHSVQCVLLSAGRHRSWVINQGINHNNCQLPGVPLHQYCSNDGHKLDTAEIYSPDILSVLILIPFVRDDQRWWRWWWLPHCRGPESDRESLVMELKNGWSGINGTHCYYYFLCSWWSSSSLTVMEVKANWIQLGPSTDKQCRYNEELIGHQMRHSSST